MPILTKALLGASLACLLIGCSEQVAPTFHAQESPQRLSDWGLFSLTEERLSPSSHSEVFQPSNRLFSDYAHKLRTLWLPQGEQLSLQNDELAYPVGSILSKTFYYPRQAGSASGVRVDTEANLESLDLAQNRMLETRLLVKRETGWTAFPYVWNDEQTEAFLRIAGATIPLPLHDRGDEANFNYFVPNENQCAGCHNPQHPEGEMHPLGALVSQLGPQLDRLVARGWLDASSASIQQANARPSWEDPSVDLAQRASEYLNINCAHCHNPDGAADTSGLNLAGTHRSLVEMGQCKPPVAAGGGSGGLQYSIVPGIPEESILLYRLESTDPAEMMPELGRGLAHREGVELIRQWIAQLDGNCE